MSGGFFRGTSADQDTRFSNKQAKLMKSQKFAPELDHLVDMSKVKMDVMRPWIANRVTELIGFEDEVLINFIYSLLDGKDVNGKEVQISLTGFMERNTGKFMKELWALLLSAQKNASGVPQQFLDAKEEETKKKKAESDRIENEIQRKREKEKESQDLEQGRNKKMDVGNDISKGADTAREPARESRGRSAEEEPKGKNGSWGRSLISKSPNSADRSSSPRRMRSRSASKSLSNSRSYSNERRRSRSLSASPKQRRRSSSSEMIRHSSPKRSLTPRRRRSPRRSLTPPRRRSSYSRRRLSPSPIRYRMRSPRRRRSRSPSGRRSRSPIRRRSRSPIWRSFARNRSRSPIWRRSPSPSRRRSPSSRRRRSPSPRRRRSPSPRRRRSPSPMRNRSPSPMRHHYRGSPLSPQSRSPSPVRRRSPMSSRRRSPSPAKSRSGSLHDWSSPSPVKRRSPLPTGRRSSPKKQRSPVESPRPRKRDLEKDSPVCHTSPRAGARRRSRSLDRRSRSDSRDHDIPRKVKALSPSPRMSSPVSEDERRISINDDTRPSGRPSSSMDKSKTKISDAYSPPRKSREHKPRHSSERSADDKDIDYHREDDKLNFRSKGTSKTSDKRKDSQHGGELSSPQSLGGSHAVQTQSRTGRTDSNKKVDLNISDTHHDAFPKLSGKLDQKDRSSFEGSGSEESDKNQSKVRGKRKNKRPERQGSESEDESSYDSYEEERREAKRRRKEERRSKKEEKRRRREERRRKKEERRAEKLKLKSVDTVYSPSDAERKGGHSDDDQHSRRRQSHRRNVEQTEPEQKKLEIELREKALENLRAKKNNH